MQRFLKPQKLLQKNDTKENTHVHSKQSFFKKSVVKRYVYSQWNRQKLKEKSYKHRIKQISELED